MMSSTFILIVLSFSAVSTQIFTSPFSVEEGVSAYCSKSTLYPNWYIASPIECCDSRGKCPRFIRPSETKYGLTNPDHVWLRRDCSCDVELYNCVTKNLTSSVWNAIKRDYGFSRETCFQRSPDRINGSNGNFEFIAVTQAVAQSIKNRYWSKDDRPISAWTRP